MQANSSQAVVTRNTAQAYGIKIQKEIDRLEGLREASLNEGQRRLYDAFVTYFKQGLQVNNSMTTSRQRVTQAYRCNIAFLSSLVDIATTCKEEMGDQERHEIVKAVQSTLGNYTLQNPDFVPATEQEKRAYQLLTKEVLGDISESAQKSLFSLIGQYDLHEDFQAGVKNHYVPWKMARAYTQSLTEMSPEKNRTVPAQIEEYRERLMSQSRLELQEFSCGAELPSQQSLYDLLGELLNYSEPANLNPKTGLPDLDKIASCHDRIFALAAKHYTDFRPVDRAQVKAIVKKLLVRSKFSAEFEGHVSEAAFYEADQAMKRVSFSRLAPETHDNFLAVVAYCDLIPEFEQAGKDHYLPGPLMLAHKMLKSDTFETHGLGQIYYLTTVSFVGLNERSLVDLSIDPAAQTIFMPLLSRRIVEDSYKVRRQSLGGLKDKAQSDVPWRKNLYGALYNLCDPYEALRDVSGDESRDKIEPIGRALAKAMASIIKLADSHYHELDPAERNGLRTELEIFLGAKTLRLWQVMGYSLGIIRKDTTFTREAAGSLNAEILPALFRLVHRLGMERDLAAVADKQFLHRKLIKTYEGWVKDNQVWIADKEWLRVGAVVKQKADISPAAVAVVAAQAVIVPVNFAVATGSGQIQKETTDPQISTAPEMVPAAEPIVLTPLERYRLKQEEKLNPGQKKNAGWVLDEPIKKAAAPVVAMPIVKGHDIDELTEEQMEELTRPAVAVTDQPLGYRGAAEVPVVVKPSTEVIAEGLVDTSLIMPVAHVRLHITSSDEDSRDDHGHKGQNQIAKYRDTQEQDKSHDRTGILLPALAKDDCPNKIVYPYIQMVDRNAEKRERPYNVIDIEFPQNEEGTTQRARVFVCNFESAATFIQRDTAEAFDPADEVDISVLRDDPKVWMVPFLKDEQWVNDIQQRLYTPVDQMKIQLKRNHFWASRGPALEETFMLHVIKTACKPSSHDTDIIESGELAGKATWLAASAALKRGTVGGFEDIRSLSGLCEYVFAKYPGLLKFTGDEPLVIAAEDLAPYCKRMKKALDVATEIGPWKIGVLELAFKYGAVKGLESVVPAGKKPECLAEFVALVRSTPRPE